MKEDEAIELTTRSTEAAESELIRFVERRRVDDRVNDRYDRRRFNAYCGVYRDEDGNLYQLTRVWHPLLWWGVLRPDSLWRGMRLSALRSFWEHRKVLLFAEEEGGG